MYSVSSDIITLYIVSKVQYNGNRVCLPIEVVDYGRKFKKMKNDDLNNSVSVILPVFNEERYIKNCIESLLNQDYDKENLEIIFVDGMSTDDTKKIINEYAEKYNFIKLIDNPNRTVQYGMNAGIKEAKGYYIVRMDAHASYAEDYISKCIEYLKKTGADNVGGTTVAKGEGVTQKIIAALYHSSFAMGGSNHYKSNYEGYTDTVSWGAFKKETLINIGTYDERLPRSEDDDLNFRIVKNGGKIFITPNIRSTYYPRSSFEGLFKQYFEYGKWKVAVIKKHKRPSRLAHLVPMLFVAFLLLGFLITIFFGKVPWIFRIVFGLYLLLDFCFSFSNSYVNSIGCKFGLMFAHFILHFSYGLGFWCGIFKFRNYKWSEKEK